MREDGWVRIAVGFWLTRGLSQGPRSECFGGGLGRVVSGRSQMLVLGCFDSLYVGWVTRFHRSLHLLSGDYCFGC